MVLRWADFSIYGFPGPDVRGGVFVSGGWRSSCNCPERMSLDRVTRGKIGEDLACEELEHRGYAILARRYRSRAGEIDIVAREGETLVFVEVKAREGQEFGGGAEAVTAYKRQRIGRVALDYLARHRRTDCPCRFDVVSIAFGHGAPAIEVYQNAFDMSC